MNNIFALVGKKNRIIFQLGAAVALSIVLSACEKEVDRSYKLPTGDSSLIIPTPTPAPVAAPSVAFKVPVAAFSINQSNQMNFSVSGTCSEKGQKVNLFAGVVVLTSTTCQPAGTFSTIINLKSIADGNVQLIATHVSTSQKSAQAEVDGKKDTIAPTVTINPAGLGNSPSSSTADRTVTLGGTDVVQYRAVAITGSDCSGASFTSVTEVPIATPFKFTPISNVDNIICAIGRDAAGNYQTTPTASPVLRLENLSIITPVKNFTVTSSNSVSFPVSGKCVDNGKNVTVSASTTLSHSAVCNAGNYATSFNLTQFVPGAITITATQTDLAGTTEKVIVVGAKLSPVCNPFGGSGPLSSTNGLVGSMSYLPPPVATSPASLAPFWVEDPITSATDMLTPTHLVPVQILSTNLNIPNQSFTAGFTSVGSNQAIKTPGTNTTLTEFFSINFRSRIQMANAQPGKYYFALISDDGSVMRIKPDATHGFKTYVNDDTLHPEKMACPAPGDMIQLSASTNLPIEVTYYQGPRTGIALQLIWKRVPDGTSTTAVADPLCGVQGGFFDLSSTPSSPEANWNALRSRGWDIVPEENFVLPDDTFNNCPQ